MNHVNLIPFSELNNQVKEVINYLDRCIPRSKRGNRDVIWPFHQMDRIGHLALEPWIVRQLFDKQLYNITALIPSQSVWPWACKDHSTYFRNLRVYQIQTKNTYSSIFSTTGLSSSNFQTEYNDRIYIFSNGANLFKCLRKIRHENGLISYYEKSESNIQNVKLFKDAFKIDKDAKLAVYHCRESGYLQNLTYHSYRDASPRNAELGISKLLNENYTVVRIGDKTMTPFNLRHENLIDLTQSPDITTSHFDLIACSDLYFGQLSGPEAIALTFNIPRIYHNTIGSMSGMLGDNSIILPKSIFSTSHGNYKTLIDMLTTELHDFNSTDQFNRNNLLPIENTPYQIEGLVKEGIDLVNGSINPNNHIRSKELIDRINKLIIVFNKNNPESPLVTYQHNLRNFFYSNSFIS